MAESKDNQYVAGKTEKILSSLNTAEETKTNTKKTTDVIEDFKGNTREYPISKGPRYYQPNKEIGYTPNTDNSPEALQEAIAAAAKDHSLGKEMVNITKEGRPVYGQRLNPTTEVNDEGQRYFRQPEFFIKNKEDHFIKDVPQGIGDGGSSNPGEPFADEDQTVTRMGYPNGKENEEAKKLGVFSGSTTNVNARGSETAAEILKKATYGAYEYDRIKKQTTDLRPPISPEYNTYRMNDKGTDETYVAQQSLFNAYNRTRIPIADQEWRKGFRYIFFTRPECYLMYREGGITDICNQAFYDEDFASAYTRMPHIIKLLSPWYITGSYPTVSTQLSSLVQDSGQEGANWNFLFSNRVHGISVNGTSMSISDTIGKSIEGYTVTPAKFVETRQGSTVDLTFTDTKNLEVYEMARLWMLYMYKRQKGIFLPPYNGYAKDNNFRVSNGATMDKLDGPLSGVQYTRMHPYDRALEYCASLYDIVTDETGSKILYWCKYYGIYPTEATPSLGTDDTGPITQVNTTISFKYHYKLENNNKTLVEFNHDAGLTDDVGKINVEAVTSSLPFMIRNDDIHDPSGNKILPKYIGAAGMFTGSPYVVMVKSRPDPLDQDKLIVAPSLRFMNVPIKKLDRQLNMDITDTLIDQLTHSVVAYQPGTETKVRAASISDLYKNHVSRNIETALPQQAEVTEGPTESSVSKKINDALEEMFGVRAYDETLSDSEMFAKLRAETVDNADIRRELFDSVLYNKDKVTDLINAVKTTVMDPEVMAKLNSYVEDTLNIYDTDTILGKK